MQDVIGEATGPLCVAEDADRLGSPALGIKTHGVPPQMGFVDLVAEPGSGAGLDFHSGVFPVFFNERGPKWGTTVVNRDIRSEFGVQRPWACMGKRGVCQGRSATAVRHPKTTLRKWRGMKHDGAEQTEPSKKRWVARLRPFFKKERNVPQERSLNDPNLANADDLLAFDHALQFSTWKGLKRFVAAKACFPYCRRVARGTS